MNLFKSTALFLFALIFISTVNAKDKRPNIILIMADDMGYECVGVNGAEEYKTPALDKLASEGVRFTNCFANPLCTPSRVKIMTGQSNVKNYVQFRVLDRSQKTFGHYLKEAGYKTAIAGKWQLGTEEDSGQHFGFDESLLWQQSLGPYRQTENGKFDSRHVNPLMQRNGKKVEYNNGEFSADVFVKFIDEFMKKNKDTPAFVYYPMVLPHCPFVPTPDTPDFDPKSFGSKNYKGKVQYFKDMVNHIDKMIARIQKNLKASGQADNTIIIFTGDNGTDKPVKTKFNGTIIPAGKGKMDDAGTRVPLIVHFPNKIKTGLVTDELVDFTDFLPTVCELAGVKFDKNIDGQSIMPTLTGKGKRNKKQVYIWYGKKGDAEKATVFARTKTHMVRRKFLSGEFELIDCSTPYEFKTIDQPSGQDKEIFDELIKTIKAKDKLRGVSLKK